MLRARNRVHTGWQQQSTVAPERIWKWGHRSGAKRWKFFWSCPSTFFVTLVVLVSTFVMVSTVWSVYCCRFFYSRGQPFVKVGARAPCLWSRCHCLCM